MNKNRLVNQGDGNKSLLSNLNFEFGICFEFRASEFEFYESIGKRPFTIYNMNIENRKKEEQNADHVILSKLTSEGRTMMKILAESGKSTRKSKIWS
jgi:hypothetical protein